MKTKYAEDYVGITSKEYEELDDRHKKVFKIFSDHFLDEVQNYGR